MTEQSSTTQPKPSSFVTPVVIHQGLAFVSGNLPRRNGELAYRGKVGGTVNLAEARDAAELCARACIEKLELAVGGRHNIERLIKVTGFVASAPGFNLQPQVIDAASAMFVELLGPAGAHARSAIGVAELPHDAPVEIEIIAAVRSQD